MLVNIECPVELLKYQFYRSKRTEKVYCSLTFNNLSVKKIKGLKITIYCFDQFGDSVNEDGNFFESNIQLIEPAAPNQYFDMNEKIAFDQFPSTRKIEVDITRILFEDQTIWDKNETELEKVDLKEITDSEHLYFIKENEGDEARYFSQKSKDRWTCICGRLNYEHTNACKRCGKDKIEVLSKYSDEEKINQNIALYKKEQEEIMLKNQEERERQLEITKQKRKKILKYSSVFAIIFLFIVAITFGIMTKFTFSIENYQLLKNKDNALIQAVKEENIENIDFLLEHGVNVNYENSDSESPIILAIKSGSKHIVQRLINAGALTEDIGERKDSVLHLSVEHDQLDLLKYLIEEGYDINTKNDGKQAVLDFAIIQGKSEVINYLMDQKDIDLNNMDKEGNNALQVALINSHVTEKNILERLLESNLNLEEENESAKNSYYTAITFAPLNTIKKMLDYGMDLNNIDNKGNNAIHVLVKERKTDNKQLLEYFLKSEVDPNAFNDAGESPIYIAILNGEVSDVELLIGHSVNIDSVTKDGESAIMVAKTIGKEMESVINRRIEEKRKVEEKKIEEKRKVEEKRIEEKRINEEKVKAENEKKANEALKSKIDIVINYHINENGIVNITPNSEQINLKVNQKIILKPTFSGDFYERVLISGPIDVINDQTIEAVEKGTGSLTIIPNGYDWEDAKVYNITID